MKALLGFSLLILSIVACSQLPNTTQLYPQEFAPGNDAVVDVAANSSGVYIAGYTDGAVVGVNKGGDDAFIRKYNGFTAWTRQFGTRFQDTPQQIAVDTQDNSYVTGTTWGALGFKIGSTDAFLQKYDTRGALQWTRQFGSSQGDFASDVVVDKNGYVYTVSNEQDLTHFVIRKWDEGGKLLLTINSPEERVWNNYRRILAISRAGAIYVVTTEEYNGSILFYKYTSTGSLVSDFPKTVGRITPNSEVLDMKLDSSDNLYMIVSVSGRSNSTGDSLLRKITSNGVWQWTKSLEPVPPVLGIGKKTSPGGLAIDEQNMIYVGASTYGTYKGFTREVEENGDVVILTYNTGGTRLRVQQFLTPKNEDVTSLAVSDALYVTGYTRDVVGTTVQKNAFVLKADKNTGALISVDE